MNKISKTIIFGALLSVQPVSAFAGGPDTADMLGVWGSVTLQGDFKALSPSLDKFKWTVMNQTRTRDDSPQGTRESENLLFSQIGYQLNDNASLWLGYVHDWINPLDKPSYQESRPYQDFLWNQKWGSFNFMARTRMEERINESNAGPQTDGYRARQLLQISHPLPFMDNLSAYVGDEVLGYVNKNTWGKQGFSENRVLAGLSYQITPKLGADLGYLGQYVDNLSGNNLFTHNIQANLRYKF
ncbi:MAG: DUF2490 domain-containing protein [Methylovulum sp.]|nr:DUF2490 domain-containing protein [Methylovulum sp.]